MSAEPTVDELRTEIAALKKELTDTRLSLERMTALADASFESIAFFDENSMCIDSNKTGLNTFGYTLEEVRTMSALDFVAPESRALATAKVMECDSTPYEAYAIRKDGSTFPALMQGVCIEQQGRTTRVSTVRDITFQKQQQEALKEAHAELDSVFTNSMVGILLLKGGRLVHRANQRLADIFGYDDPAEMIGLSVRDFHISQKHFEEFGALFFNALMTRDLIQVKYQLRRKDGSPIWVALSGKAIDTSAPLDLNKGVLWMIDDITEIKETEDRLTKLASIDPLTTVLNRRRFMELGELEVTRQKNHLRGLSLLMIDIDHFKVINDTHGHDVGDLALQTFTTICKGCLRDADILGRMGGEEFAIILPGTGMEQALAVAERIRKTVKESTKATSAGIPAMTTSIGVTSVQDEQPLVELLKQADQMLYKAKMQGRDRTEPLT